MASKVSTTLIDDIDGSDAAETVEFGLGGATYEIDLSADNAEKLRAMLGPWVSVARRTGGRRARHTTPKEDLGPVRVWARENGYTVGDKGRVPTAIITAFWNRDTVKKVPVTPVQSTMKRARSKAKASGVDAPTFSEQ